jgi:hypothetical protein
MMAKLSSQSPLGIAVEVLPLLPLPVPLPLPLVVPLRLRLPGFAAEIVLLGLLLRLPFPLLQRTRLSFLPPVWDEALLLNLDQVLRLQLALLRSPRP